MYIAMYMYYNAYKYTYIILTHYYSPYPYMHTYRAKATRLHPHTTPSPPSLLLPCLLSVLVVKIKQHPYHYLNRPVMMITVMMVSLRWLKVGLKRKEGVELRWERAGRSDICVLMRRMHACRISSPAGIGVISFIFIDFDWYILYITISTTTTTTKY